MCMEYKINNEQQLKIVENYPLHTADYICSLMRG